eukprot:m.206314 g.206314  ORF g.206314 m.206314 type:complete len:320 (-) comp15020_c1_seq5:1417-2376(-)
MAKTPKEVRERIGSGYHGMNPTSGLCAGYLQANLVVMPSAYADDFEEFCKLNCRACPLLFRSAPGQVDAGPLAANSDVRRELPAYKVFKSGAEPELVADISEHWTDDLVTFYVGCSFSFENALNSAGVPVRNIEQKKNVSMYKTNRQCEPVGPFSGALVVSMRPIPKSKVETAIEVTERSVLAHGGPIYCGDGAMLGISDLNTPDFGEAVISEEADVPCFWACGVTCMTAVMDANLPLVITHSPGCMFIADILETASVPSPILSGFSSSLMATANAVERRIQVDPGNRGVSALALPSQVWHAALWLAGANKVVLTTGMM